MEITYTVCGHRFIFQSGSDAFWHRFSERATFATALKGSVSKRGRPFMWKNMDPFHPKFRYKGAKPFWLWSTGELLLYFAIIAIILILSYFFN